LGTQKTVKISNSIDGIIVGIVIVLSIIGWFSIFSVQYREGQDVFKEIARGKLEYGKQLWWMAVCSIIAITILLTDSRFFNSTANLQYGFGLFLMLLVFPFHASISGTKSIIKLGPLNLQPAELCKIFTLLALAHFIASVEGEFTKFKNHLIAATITLIPAVLSIAQSETGLALVYIALFLAMYREGLPIFYLTYTVVFFILFILALLLSWQTLVAINVLSLIAYGYFYKKANRRKPLPIINMVAGFAIALVIQLVAVPQVFTNVLKPYQGSRIKTALGVQRFAFEDESKVIAKAAKDANSYNVDQSKIAIGSGKLIGRGYLNNTQTRMDFVPEQHTDFIFCSVAESFGFVGSIVLFALYFILLWRITVLAERQRSTFSRVYAYGVACIIFFHIMVNLGMTMGIVPVIGIPLPFLSYGGTSLITFTVLIFILVRLDTDRAMAFR
jgi:rod shape determining protein RodA